MKNLTLKQGDLVEALRSGLGLTKGRVYLVESSQGQGLVLTKGLDRPLELVGHDGTLRPWSELVKVLQCPIVLSRGHGQGPVDVPKVQR
jgi:hypothetical protein